MSTLADLVTVSKTQPVEVIEQIYRDRGFEPEKSEEVTDQPEKKEPPKKEEPVKAEEEPPVEATPVEGAVVEDKANEVIDETPPVEVKPPVETPPIKKNIPGSQRLKFQKQELESEVEKLRRENEQLRQSQTTTTTTKTEEKPVAAPVTVDLDLKALGLEPQAEPDLEKDHNNDWEAYQKAYARWTAKDERRLERIEEIKSQRQTELTKKAEETANTEKAQREHQEQGRQRWATKRDAAREKYNDWDSVLEKDFAKPVHSDVMGALIEEYDQGADILYWIATHEDEAHEIYLATNFDPTKASDPDKRRAFRAGYDAFDKILTELNAGSAGEKTVEPVTQQKKEEPPKQAPKSAAVTPKFTPKPDPPKPVGARSVAPAKISLDDPAALRKLSSEDYRKMRDSGELR